MANLFMPTHTPYHAIYDALRKVRETFHRAGRVSDANAKLEETVKFLAIHYGYVKGLVNRPAYLSLAERSTFTVQRLNSVFAQVGTAAVFCRRGIGPIFGTTPSTIFESGDEEIAHELFALTRLAFRTQTSHRRSLDVLNEAFGHHVRDNFRSHIEDAQYMTPPEVVNFMVSLALDLLPAPTPGKCEGLLVADPTCGVGSFLTSWRSAYRAVYGPAAARRVRCIGQDKVDRMVRLSAMNFILSESDTDDVFLGNSIHDASPLGAYNNQVDLILTNPPFGARFVVNVLQSTSPKSTPFFAQARTRKRVVESELLFIDRYISLLKRGGICLAIVPDGVISGKGAAATVRQYIARKAELISVVELPAVTFAQAGTRAKTVVLGFKKEDRPRNVYPVFFSAVQDLGFRVAQRKGVPIKKLDGSNQLPKTLAAFQARHAPTTTSGTEGPTPLGGPSAQPRAMAGRPDDCFLIAKLSRHKPNAG